ncbi:MAG: hypothetical protein ACYS74_07385, partial [Planctomycetota bacterium]
MDVQAVHEQRRVLGAIGVPAVFENVVGEGADGVEVFGALIRIGWFCGGAWKNKSGQDEDDRDIQSA